MKKIFFLATIAILFAVGLGGIERRTLASTAMADNKLVIEHLNLLRSDPANARATIDKIIAAAYPEEQARNEFLNEEVEGKKVSEHINAIVAFAATQPKLAPVQWDEELVGVAANEGKANNKYFKPELMLGLAHIDPLKSLVATLSNGYEFEYKPLFRADFKFAAVAPKASKADDLVLVLTSMPAKAYTMSDDEVSAGAYDPRLDVEPAWVGALSVKEPNVTPFVKADGSIDIAWRRMSDKRVFITRYSSGGSKVWTKEVPGVSDEHILLAGFTEDPQGNMYVARAKDEGYLDKEREPSTPKENPNNQFDRPDMMRLTKLDSNGKELWTNDFAKKGGSALAFFSPLSPNPIGGYSATSKIAFTTIKRTTYKLASDENVIVPTNVAEESLLGYSVDKLGKRSPNRFPQAYQPTEAGGVISPKVKLSFRSDYTKGKLSKPVEDDDKKIPFTEDGRPALASEIEFSAADFGPFNEFIDANKEGTDSFSIAADKLKLKSVMDEVPIVFVIYGGATDFDEKPEFKMRHQNAYWRVLDARTGEPLDGYNHGAMAHSFDYSVLVTDEGIITAERSDGFMLLSNPLQTGRPKGPIFLPAVSTVSNGNECYCTVGGLAPASDGYMFLYMANNSKYDVTANADDGVSESQYNEESVRQRDIGVLRVKKGFAQEIESWATKDSNVLDQILDSRKKPAAATSLFLQPRKYITSYYRDGQPYSAGRARFVRVAENQYVVFWERWNHVVSKNREGRKELSGSYDSTWAMKIDQNGNVLKPAVKISDSVRLMRGDDPVATGGKAAFFAGDALTGKLMYYTIDGDLKLGVQALPLN